MSAAANRRPQRVSLVERIKAERPPLALLTALPELAAVHYAAVSEDDILRLQWLGLYHDKPRIGRFMLRVRLPGGVITPAQLAALSQVSSQWGGGVGELTTRQDIQLHEIELAALPDVLRALDAAQLSTLGACGDVLRNITACPLAGRHPHEVFDISADLAALVERFGVRREADLPRKHKWSLSACPEQCVIPEFHDIGILAQRHQGADGFVLRLGGGLSTTPRIARELGAFIPRALLGDALAALLARWRDDPRYRQSRGRARFKFLVDDVGPIALREVVEAQLGPLVSVAASEPVSRAAELGVFPQRQAGLVAIGVAVAEGLFAAERMAGVAQLASAAGAGIRLSREQNLLLVDVPSARVASTLAELGRLGLMPSNTGLAGTSIACTGDPYCNFALGATKPALHALRTELASRFGEQLGALRIYLDGCPHACGQHWIGDIGLQGTTARVDGERVAGFDVYLRGRLGAAPRIGQVMARKVPVTELASRLGKLLERYIEHRAASQSFADWITTCSDDELAASLASSTAVDAALAGNDPTQTSEENEQ
jgi:ferredoxin-nitrite reductase